MIRNLVPRLHRATPLMTIFRLLLLLFLAPFVCTYSILLRDNTVQGVELAENVLPGVKGDHLIFSLLQSPASKYFVVNNRTGQLSSARTIDRDFLCTESALCCTTVQMDLRSMMHSRINCPNQLFSMENKVCVFNLSVSVVVADGQLPDTYEVAVIVCEENDHAPVFKVNQNTVENQLMQNGIQKHAPPSYTHSYQVNLSESSPIGHRVRLPLAQDVDAPPFHVTRYILEPFHANVQSMYTLEEDPFQLEVFLENGHILSTTVNNNNFHTSVHQPDVISGVELVLKQQLDRESVPQYDYRLLAVDGGTPPRTGSLHLQIRVTDANDHAPQFSKSVYQVTVDEGVVGREVLRMVATDRDEGPNAIVRYGWAPWGPHASRKQAFSEPLRQSESLQSMSKDELAKVPPNYWFGLNAETGVLYLQHALDYEVMRQHRFEVIAFNPTDVSLQSSDPIPPGSHAFTATATVIVDVRNLNDEAPEILVDYANGGVAAYKEIRENSPPSYFVAFITVSDPDLNDFAQSPGSLFHSELGDAYPVTCRLDSHQDTYMLKRDKLIKATSAVKLRYTLSTKVSLDRELGEEDRVVILCEDSDTPQKVASAVVTVRVLDENDCIPELQVLVPASEQSSRPNPLKPWPSEFLKHLVNQHTSCPIPLVTAYTSDIPVYSVQLIENQPIGSIVARIRSNDKDSGDNGHVTFELPSIPILVNVSRKVHKNIYLSDSEKLELLSSPEAVEYFQIDEISGDISTRISIDRENIHSFLDHLFVVVKATDHGSEIQHTTYVLLHITIVDENDNPPVFVNPSMQFEIAENVPAPAFVGEVQVYDPDLDRIVHTSEDSAFSQLIAPMLSHSKSQSRLHVRIDPGHGRQNLPFILYRTPSGKFFLNTTRVLDRESEEAFQFVLIATDNDLPHGHLINERSRRVHTATASVLITVLDTNDNQPEIIFPNPSTSNSSVHRISYREAAGYDIININANDRDASEANGKFYFEIVPDSSSVELFTIDRVTGVLRTRRRMTTSDIGEHFLQILVRDEGTPPMEARLTLRLLVDHSEPHNQGDVRSVNGVLGTQEQSYAHLSNSENQLFSAYQLDQDQSKSLDSRWDFKRTLQSDILLIVIITMILILIIIMLTLCFYLRHKRKLFGFLPDLYGFCASNRFNLESNDLAFTQKSASFRKNHSDLAQKHHPYTVDVNCNGLMDSLIGYEQHQQGSNRDSNHGQSNSSPSAASPLFVQSPSHFGNPSAQYHSSMNLSTYANHEHVQGVMQTRSGMPFSPTVIGSHGVFSPTALHLAACRPQTSMAFNLPDVTDPTSNTCKFYLDYNRIDQQHFTTPVRMKPLDGYDNSRGRGCPNVNAYNCGRYLGQYNDAMTNTLDPRHVQVNFRPIPDHLHLYQHIHPEDAMKQSFIQPSERNHKSQTARRSKPDPVKFKPAPTSKDLPGPYSAFSQCGMTQWRSDPSLCHQSLDALEAYGFQEYEKEKMVGQPCIKKRSPRSVTGRSNSQERVIQFGSDLRNNDPCFESPEDSGGEKRTNKNSFATHGTENYAITFPKLQASFV